MRTSISLRYYLLLFAILLGFIGLSKEASLALKGTADSILAPAWESLRALKFIGGESSERHLKEELEKLHLDNHLLSNRIQNLEEILENEKLIQTQLINYGEKEKSIAYLNSLRRRNIHRLLSGQLQSIPAQVIYRPPDAWNNFLWINVGSEDNKALEKETVAKNSPVVVGTAVAGVIDYVGSHQSKVRLITDSSLAASVRVLRIQAGEPACHLAKGQLCGSVKRGIRREPLLLKGTGFNYDYPDEEGPARDLRTGEVYGSSKQSRQMPIIQAGDLLITTGMDGVFPHGLRAAVVTRIDLLGEGDYYYDIEAQACLDNFDALNTVFVLPPLNSVFN